MVRHGSARFQREKRQGGNLRAPCPLSGLVRVNVAWSRAVGRQFGLRYNAEHTSACRAFLHVWGIYRFDLLEVSYVACLRGDASSRTKDEAHVIYILEKKSDR